MGRRNPDRIPFSYRRRQADTVQQMREQGWDIIARCDHCRVMLRVDLRVVIRMRGREFSLWNQDPLQGRRLHWVGVIPGQTTGAHHSQRACRAVA